MCGEPKDHLLRYALANVLRACDLRGALTHIRPFPGIHAEKPHMIFRKNPGRILRKYHRCLRSENEFFMSRSMAPALRRSEIPGEQIARFVRWVYFALKRRGLRKNTSCSMLSPGRCSPNTSSLTAFYRDVPHPCSCHQGKEGITSGSSPAHLFDPDTLFWLLRVPLR